MRLPDPALVVLVGASGSGKSTWAAQRYRSEEVVSSDALRGVVGSGPYDLDASDDAFAVLEAVVAARVGRGLTTVVDTLGTDAPRRRGWLAAARRRGLPAVAVLLEATVAECRRRNAERDRPVPARVVDGQVRRVRAAANEVEDEGWDLVVRVAAEPGPADAAPRSLPAPTSSPGRRASHGAEVVLQVSRFPWGEEPMTWLRDVALAADDAGFAGVALMDHLVQIPQVGRAWDPIPEPWVALGALAGLGTGLRLGTLCTPVTFRPAGVTAKAAATLSALTAGRTFLGVGAGWWEREHSAYGLPFPGPRERIADLERAIVTMRALWAPGTRPFDRDGVALTETTCYPRPTGTIPVVVGGSGERGTLRVAARVGDACNLPARDPDLLRHQVEVLRRHCARAGRDAGEVAVTVLDLPVVGRDRDDVWARVERHRGGLAASAYAARTHAGTVAEHRDRHAALAADGVTTIFLATPDLDGADRVLELSGLAT